MTINKIKLENIVPVAAELLVQKMALDEQMALNLTLDKRKLLIRAIVHVEHAISALADLKELLKNDELI